MITITTRPVRRGFSARAYTAPDSVGSNYPTEPVGVCATAFRELDAATRCARKALRILRPYAAHDFTVKPIVPTLWQVCFGGSR